MWVTRPATMEDVPGLRELCTLSVGADDYALGFLEPFIRESVTFVAVDGGRIVGMMVYDDTPDGAVWLHAARTHPEHRRRGVAASLNRACEELARARGRSCLRLWAAASNTASVAASARYGFEERARFTRMRISAAPPVQEVHLEPLDPAEAWIATEGSPLLRRTAGYVFHDFYFLPLSQVNTALLARQGALWRFGGNGVALSEDFEEAGGRDLQVQLLFGDAAEILRTAPAIGRARGAERVESFLPHDTAILASARRAGYDFMEWGQEAVLFEKPIPATSE